MPTLPTQSFATIVANTIAGIQGRASNLINFSIGSTLRAIVEGFAGVYLWFQALVLQLLTAIRLSTASGIDVDTFTADFMPVLPGSVTATLPSGSPRLGAQASSGQVMFARYTAGPTSCFISVGPLGGGLSTNADTLVKTNDGKQTFFVNADPTYPTYSATLGGYTLPSTVATIIVPVVNTVAGAAGNVAAGSITVISSTVRGIDTVVNNASFTNGADFESDGALKKRFSDYILGLSRGDLYGLQAAIEGIGVTVQFTYTEDYNFDGSWRAGYVSIIADDGSGNPPPSFMQAVTNAAYSVRPLGIQFGVFLPTILWATVSMQITVASGFNLQTVEAAVGAALATNINSLGLGNPLPWSILASWAYAVPGVASVTAVFLNGATGDQASLVTTRPTFDGLNVINYQTIKCRTVIVS